jgi:hypothetical protein
MLGFQNDVKLHPYKQKDAIHPSQDQVSAPVHVIQNCCINFTKTTLAHINQQGPGQDKHGMFTNMVLE